MVGGGGESIVLKPSKIILSYMDISKTAISSVYEVPTMGQVLYKMEVLRDVFKLIKLPMISTSEIMCSEIESSVM